MIDGFSKEKSDFLNKKDKSKKGSMDKGVIPLIKEINSKNNYYTTSSCAGRIVLLEMNSRKKNECSWIFKKHDKVSFDEIFYSLKNKKFRFPIWFKQQPLILHVACRDLESAKRFLETARKIFRRAGIIAITERKVTIEVIGSGHLETIVAEKNFICDKIFLKVLVKYANRNFEENRKKIGKFARSISSL